jgi:hypothetical protein
MNVNISLKQTSYDESTKGYLYKIQNPQGKTQGYLFGTIHLLDSERLLKLHPKIFKYIGKCDSLFLEINPLDSSLLSREIKRYTHLGELEDIKAIKIIERIKLEVLSHPEGVEHIITNHALSIKMEIKSLETIESRLRAKIDTENDRESLKVKVLAISAFAIKNASNKLVAVTNPLESDKEMQLIEAYKALINAIKQMDFKSICDYRAQRLEMKSLLNKLIDSYEIIFIEVYGKEGKNLMTTVRILYKTLKQFDHGNSPIFEQWLKRVQEAYFKRDRDLRSEYPTKGNLVDKKIKEVDLKERFLRDKFMLKSIQKNLKESSGKKPNFYAVGSAHPLDNYENLRIMLEKKVGRL